MNHFTTLEQDAKSRANPSMPNGKTFEESVVQQLELLITSPTNPDDFQQEWTTTPPIVPLPAGMSWNETLSNSFEERNANCGVCKGDPEICVGAGGDGSSCTAHDSALALMQARVAERTYPPFQTMIKNLFKVMPGNNHEALLHAVVGMMGEATELMAATTRENAIEESGDLEFYIEAASQQLPAAMLSVQDVTTITDSARKRSDLFSGNGYMALVVIGGDILDVVKKSWVYGKTLDVVKLTHLMVEFELVLRAIYRDIDTDVDSVRHANQVKLIGPGGRFESGFYSDGAAIARADKIGEEPIGHSSMERRFFGQSN